MSDPDNTSPQVLSLVSKWLEIEIFHSLVVGMKGYMKWKTMLQVPREGRIHGYIIIIIINDNNENNIKKISNYDQIREILFIELKDNL